jgi:hypothetical protein
MTAYQRFSHLPDHYRVLLMFHIVMRMLVSELQAFVVTGLRKAIQEAENSEDGDIAAQVAYRRRHLKAWSSLVYPFEHVNTTIQNLAAAIKADGNIGNNDLPFVERHSIPGESLAGDIIHVAASKSNKNLKAPFVKTFRSLILLRKAYCYAHNIFKEAISTSKCKLSPVSQCKVLMRITLSQNRIHLLPWTRDTQPGCPGTATLRPCVDSWILVVGNDYMPGTELFTPDDPAQDANIAAAHIVAGTNRSPWNVMDCTLNNLRHICTHTVVPSEISLTNASVETYTSAKTHHTGAHIPPHYNWTVTTFSPSNKAHRMILYAARIAAGVLPNIFVPRAVGNYKDPRKTALENMQDLPLITENRGGSNSPGPFIVLFVGAALGLIMPESPLLQSMSKNKMAFGKAWTHKHGKLNNLSFVSLL